MARMLSYRLRNALRARGFELLRSNPSSNLLALHLSYLLRRYEINCVIDVGAREGEFGWWLRGTGYRGRIVSFEPNSDHHDMLRRVASRDGNWDVQPFALGAEDATATINITEQTHFSSFHEPGPLAVESFPESRVVERREVPVRRLDGLFHEAVAGIREPRVYLKLDTQGWDLEVLRGAEGCLAQVAAVQTEVSFRALYVDMPSFADSWKALTVYGYAISGIFPITVDQKLRLVEGDCVAVRAPDA